MSEPGTKLSVSTLFHIAFTLLGAGATAVSLYYVKTIPSIAMAASPYFFPLIVGAGLTVVASIGTVVSLYRDEKIDLSDLKDRRFLGVLGSVVSYAALMKPAGFLFSTAAFAACANMILGSRRSFRILVFALAIAFAFWQLFVIWLGLSLPEGWVAVIWRR